METRHVMPPMETTHLKCRALTSKTMSTGTGTSKGESINCIDVLLDFGCGKHPVGAVELYCKTTTSAAHAWQVKKIGTVEMETIYRSLFMYTSWTNL
jgi:hypothetical protein